MNDLRESTVVGNLIDCEERLGAAGRVLENLNPATGQRVNSVTASEREDVEAAVTAAQAAFPLWSQMPAVARGNHLFALAQAMEDNADALAAIAAEETGKRFPDARGEVGGAVQCARFFAGEGTRLFGRTMPSGTSGKYNMTVRQPIGVAGLIIASNTPIANVAWKLFPALVCGNTVVMKAAETAPGTALAVGRLAVKVGFPKGVFNIVQGNGTDAGAPLVEHPGVPIISFTGSSKVGQWIAEAAARQLKKVSLELGGKNPFIVCSDADLDRAARWAALSIFSNAGQRCAAASRLLIEANVYDAFKERLLAQTRSIRLGTEDDCNCGPVMTEAALERMVDAVTHAVSNGATLLAGGQRAAGSGLEGGFYMEPTLLEGIGHDAPISRTELFGPVGVLYSVADYAEALRVANDSSYGLTAAIHTSDVDRAMHFAHHVDAGVAVVNAGTYGSEPHMPFGGLKRSGNGTREPGTEALDIYSNLKDIYIVTEPDRFRGA